jgi:hypothetical protein
MGIKIGFSKTVVNGIRGRAIRSIRALEKEQLPEEYLEQLGAIHREELKDGAQSLQVRLVLGIRTSQAYQKKAHITLLSTGMWLPETRFNVIQASISKAGDLLRKVNEWLLKEWVGEEIVLITADGAKEDSTSLLKIQLRTSKVYKDKQKYRELRGVTVDVNGTVLSEQICDEANERVLNVIDKLQFFFKPVTEREFQRGVFKLRRMVHKFEHRFWQGHGVIII